LFSVLVKLPGPLFVFFDGFCFLCQLLLDECIMHQVHTSVFNGDMCWFSLESKIQCSNSIESCIDAEKRYKGLFNVLVLLCKFCF